MAISLAASVTRTGQVRQVVWSRCRTTGLTSTDGHPRLGHVPAQAIRAATCRSSPRAGVTATTAGGFAVNAACMPPIGIVTAPPTRDLADLVVSPRPLQSLNHYAPNHHLARKPANEGPSSPSRGPLFPSRRDRCAGRPGGVEHLDRDQLGGIGLSHGLSPIAPAVRRSARRPVRARSTSSPATRTPSRARIRRPSRFVGRSSRSALRSCAIG
jgi:hypothetical protein